MRYIIFLLGIVFYLSSCSPGYVSTEPTYLEVSRPAQPSLSHVWLTGDWEYNRRSRAYTRRDGHWEVPNRGRSFVPGSWKSNQRGHYWVRGRWK